MTETLSYDALNQLVESSASNGGQEYYVYDAKGNRVLTRSTSAGTTTLTAYPFGLQERTSSGSGTYQSQIDYDTIAGHLIGWSSGTSTTYDLTDALGSVVLSFSAGGIQGEQLSGPYGNQRYMEGSLGTDKGYTGQFADSITGLDYYNARWYDPVSGRFVSPDSVQGNAQGMDPYAYVEGNPETRTDPTGHWGWAIAAVVVLAAAVTAPFWAPAILPAAAAGVICTFAGAYVGGAIFGGVTAGIGDLVDTISGHGPKSLSDLMDGVGVGSIAGGITGMIGQSVAPLLSKAVGFATEGLEGTDAQATGNWVKGCLNGGWQNALSAAAGAFFGQVYQASAQAVSTVQLAAAQEKDPARKAMEARQAKEYTTFVNRLRVDQQQNTQSIRNKYQSNWRAYYDYAVFEAAVTAGAADNGTPVRFGHMNIS